MHGTTDNHLVTSAQAAPYPGLAGMVAVVAGDGDAVVEVARVLAANRVLHAVVSRDRAVVTAATQFAEASNVAIIGLSSDPGDATAWERNRPQIEQRLGPIDIVIAIGPDAVRAQVAAAFVPDLRTRRHGVVVDVDADVRGGEPLGDGVHHICIRTADMDVGEIAASVVSSVSDVAKPEPQD